LQFNEKSNYVQRQLTINTHALPDIIKKIKKVHIKTGRMVNTLMAGQYRSVFRGAGIEFEEVREYAPVTT
jgi:L-ribulose-5-phosphate 3-epimerase UlaE